LQDDDEAAPPPKQVSAPTLANNLNSDSPPAGKEQVLEEEEEEEANLELVEKSQLGKAISRQLKEVYIPLEVWYLRSAIERVSSTFHSSLIAHSADCPP